MLFRSVTHNFFQRGIGNNNNAGVSPTYTFGYTPAIVDLARSQRPDLLVTVDNGIASVDGVAHARALGLQVLITDHHLPALVGEHIVLPAADGLAHLDFPADGVEAAAAQRRGAVEAEIASLLASIASVKRAAPDQYDKMVDEVIDRANDKAFAAQRTARGNGSARAASPSNDDVAGARIR